MSSSNENKNQSGNKRKQSYYHHGGKNKSKYQPKRGGPAILLTCETGREKKCQREGLQIINYYYRLLEKGDANGNNVKAESEASKNKVDTDKEDEAKEKKTLNLDDELAQLKSNESGGYKKLQNLVHNGPFAVYDTGCRGSVFILNALPNCSLIPNIRGGNKKDASEATEGGKEADEDENEPDAKKQKTEEDTTQKDETADGKDVKDATADEDKKSSPWDPRALVRRVVADLKHEISSKSRNRGIPGSRYVVRMIPIQATCFASIEEITTTFEALLNHTLSTKYKDEKDKEAKTFSVAFKKRNCNNVTRDQVIEGIVTEVNKATTDWKVNIKNPDFRIQVEICKTLCGMSIVHASEEDSDMSSHNFNLADLRTAAAEAQD